MNQHKQKTCNIDNLVFITISKSTVDKWDKYRINNNVATYFMELKT